MTNTPHLALRPSVGQRVAALAAAAAMCLVVVGGTLGLAATYTGEADQVMARLWPRAQAVAKAEGERVADERCAQRARGAEVAADARPTHAPAAASCAKRAL